MVVLLGLTKLRAGLQFLRQVLPFWDRERLFFVCFLAELCFLLFTLPWTLVRKQATGRTELRVSACRIPWRYVVRDVVRFRSIRVGRPQG